MSYAYDLATATNVGGAMRCRLPSSVLASTWLHVELEATSFQDNTPLQMTQWQKKKVSPKTQLTKIGWEAAWPKKPSGSPREPPWSKSRLCLCVGRLKSRAPWWCFPHPWRVAVRRMRPPLEVGDGGVACRGWICRVC